MTDLTTSAGADGSTIYQGHVPAGDLGRETGTKDGQTLRVLPYGYVAHDQASNPSSMIAVSITVGADETIQVDLRHVGWSVGLDVQPPVRRPRVGIGSSPRRPTPAPCSSAGSLRNDPTAERRWDAPPNALPS